MKEPSVDAVRMSGGRLFHAAGPATQNARFPRRRLVRGMTRSPRAAERTAERVETDENFAPDPRYRVALRTRHGPVLGSVNLKLALSSSHN